MLCTAKQLPGPLFLLLFAFFVFQNHFLDISFQPRFHLWWKALTKWQSYNFKFILWEEDEAAESKNLANWAGCWAEAKINKPSMHCEAAHEGRGPLSNTSGCYSGTLCWQPDHGGQIHCSAHECQKNKALAFFHLCSWPQALPLGLDTVDFRARDPVLIPRRESEVSLTSREGAREKCKNSRTVRWRWPCRGDWTNLYCA